MQTRFWLAKDTITRLWPERLLQWFVWKLPTKIVYWAVVRGAVSTTDEYPGEVKALEILGALNGKCPRDTDGDGDCGRKHCPVCGPRSSAEEVRSPAESTRRDLVSGVA